MNQPAPQLPPPPDEIFIDPALLAGGDEVDFGNAGIDSIDPGKTTILRPEEMPIIVVSPSEFAGE